MKIATSTHEVLGPPMDASPTVDVTTVFERAHGGTLLTDEIGDLPLALVGRLPKPAMG